MTKFLQLLVPNYDGSGGASTTTGPPLTYLRLGTAYPDRTDSAAAYSDTTFAAATANEAVASTDTGNELLKAKNTSGVTVEDQLLFAFKDDGWTPHRPDKTYFYWDGASVDESTTNPSTITAKLLTRGGYRDHTDGNRISTTRGDCVEIVGGNYRLVVMGRVEGAHVGMSYWESSGGHNHDSTSTPGEVKTIGWSTNEDGTWKVVDETIRGNVVSYFQGKQEEHFFGPSQESITTKGDTADNSFTTDYPILESETYAKSISGETHADSVTETTTIRSSGSSTEYTYSDHIEDFTGACPLEEVMLQVEATYADSVTSRLVFKDRHQHSIGAMSVAVTLAPQAELTTGAAFGLDLCFAAADLSLAAKAEMAIGGGFTFATTSTWEYKLAAKLEIDLGLLLLGALITLGGAIYKGHVALAEMRAAAQDTDAEAVTSVNGA